MLFAGLTSKMLVAAIEGQNYWDQFAPYAFILSMALTITGQQGLLNSALEHGPIMTVFPIFQAFFVGFGVVGGIVFYDVSLSGTALALHLVAAVLILLGCGCLMKHGRSHWIAKHERKLEQITKRNKVDGAERSADEDVEHDRKTSATNSDPDAEPVRHDDIEVQVAATATSTRTGADAGVVQATAEVVAPEG